MTAVGAKILDNAGRRLVRNYAAPLSIAGLSLLLSPGSGIDLEWARYDRAAILGGELWRLVTAHFVHLGWAHLALNLFALALLALLFAGVLSTLDWFVTACISIAVIDAGFVFGSPQLDWYVGLSGLLHGITIVGAIRMSLEREVSGYLLFAAVIAKVAWEQWHGPSALSIAASGGPVVVDAHLYGALGGVISFVTLGALQRRARHSL